MLLALAYPDRIAQRRPGPTGRFLLRNGLGAVAGAAGLSSGEEYLVVAELEGKPPESRILLAAPISIEEIRTWFADDIVAEEVVEWDPGITSRSRRGGGSVSAQWSSGRWHCRNPDPDRVARALLEGVRREGLHVLPWDDGATTDPRAHHLHPHAGSGLAGRFG